MPFQRPTLSTLVDRTQSDIETRLPGADARLPRSVLQVLAIALAGGLHEAHGFLTFISRQVFPDSAETEFLDRWASLWGIERKPPVAAGGTVAFAGANGTVIPAGTVLQRSDGLRYTTQADVAIAGGAASVAVIAQTLGSTGNSAAGARLDLAAAIAGAEDQATVAVGGLAAGADAETDDELRLRLVARIQQPPHGGADFDYVAWATAVPGVTRAWCYPFWLGEGTVGVTFVMDEREDVIPASPDVAAVQAAIDARRPVTARVTVFAPIPDTIAFTVHLNPDSAAIRTAVAAELTDLFVREAVPGGTIRLSHIRQAISNAAGEVDHTLTAPSADVVAAAGHIARLGAITWA